MPKSTLRPWLSVVVAHGIDQKLDMSLERSGSMDPPTPIAR